MMYVSILQAVRTVATKHFDPEGLSATNNVSILQAVRTVATRTYEIQSHLLNTFGFNTASGKNCCNDYPTTETTSMIRVSILQAVRTVATVLNLAIRN